jgi:hypothetical protein
MKLGSFRGPKWRGLLRWSATIFGIGFIVKISNAVAKDLTQMWPGWSAIIWAVIVAIEVFLSWLFVKRVHRAADDEEFD